MGDTDQYLTADYITFHQVSGFARNITILLSCNTIHFQNEFLHL